MIVIRNLICAWFNLLAAQIRVSVHLWRLKRAWLREDQRYGEEEAQRLQVHRLARFMKDAK